MVCIIVCGSEKVKYIEAALDHFGEDYETIPLEEVKSTDFSRYSGIIISGSPILLIEDTEHNYLELFDFLRDYERPVLGICFGHQIMGLVFGSEISIGDSIKGLEKINVVVASKIFTDIPTMSEFDQNHREHVTVPPNFKLLATSASSENEAMEHEIKPLYGVQFHPETSGEMGKKLIQNFLHICK